MMMTQSNNKRIVKNTLFLYIRMFLMMGISLYTSRIILATLGVTDYGKYYDAQACIVINDEDEDSIAQ